MNNQKDNKPINWAGVATLVGAGIGSFIGLEYDHIILYTLIGALIGLLVGTYVTKKRKS
ncbi:hypothetical protein QGN29_04440 [Temperatibacter marinus]|uniref:Glycine zipper family protein n=1 Tax=Temperatibacter marinus TaxID=1456591 RepID=A0AA52H9W5_9PROT|nr:hypothetical protein [Temperatibacter marinus]WND03621.1 hypothetical protein QGN29_04440 [Temperatibacter marinus]